MSMPVNRNIYRHFCFCHYYAVRGGLRQRFIKEDCQQGKAKTMKNRFSCLLTTISIIVVMAGCSKQKEKPSIQEKLTGTWQWASTDGGIAAHIHRTPANTGKNVDLKITADGKYAIFTNDILTSEGTYTLETRKCIHDHANKTYIKFSSDPDFMVEYVDAERLEVSDEAYDGLGSKYRRKNSIGI
jgi:hypothetical protein